MYNTSNVYIYIYVYTDTSTNHWLPWIPTSSLSKRIVQSGLWPHKAKHKMCWIILKKFIVHPSP